VKHCAPALIGTAGMPLFAVQNPGLSDQMGEDEICSNPGEALHLAGKHVQKIDEK